MKKSDRIHLDKVAALGCIVCVRCGLGQTPAEIHHIREGYGKSQRAPHTETLPLCETHHRTGDGTMNFRGHVGFHFSPAAFVEMYGAERELLEIVREKLNAI